MARIAIDMDEVIADFIPAHVALYNEAFSGQITLAHLQGKKLRDLDPERKDQIKALLDTPNFFRDLAVMPGSQDVIRRLSERHEIFITTAAMEVPASFAAKYEWLSEHFPFLSDMNFVFCGDKSIINADYLIDDNVKHFAGFRGQGLLYSAPHNIHVTGYVRVNNWQDVWNFFESAPQ